MKLFIGTAAMAAALALPALAQDTMDYSTMTCADFSAMDQAGMTAAFQGMQASMPSGGDAASTGTASTDTAAAGSTASTDAASTDTATADAGSTDTASTDTAGASGDMAMDPMMTGLADACAADPSMMVMDAMAQAQGSMGGAGATDATATDTSGG